VTEGGYFIDPATGHFDPDAPEIRADAAAPARPATAFGAIIAALRLRQEAGVQPFTVMSCDNLPGNGHVARATVAGLARLSDPALADWIDANVAFPNGMVDRITPATGPREREMAAAFGLDDPVPVTCEPFRQWVIEDHFPAGRPPLEKVGVTFTPHVHAYEAMKIRILNGGHAIIAYAAGLMDIEYVHQAMANPLVSGLLAKVERDEVIPHVPPVPGTDLAGYFATVCDRFANPEVADTVRRLCLDGSNRQPKFIVPSIRDNLAAGRLPEGLILESALWCRYCMGRTDSGAEVAPNDPNWDQLQRVALQANEDPGRWLAMQSIYGDVGQRPDVAACFRSWIERLRQHGTARVIADFLGQ
jgi:mannitol 2-dehydrogenase